LDYIARKQGMPMPAENNLTVRDYFDRVIGSEPRYKPSPSSARNRSTGTGRFHRILSTRQKQAFNKPQPKSVGLKIADYLARPVRAKYKLKPRPTVMPAAENTTDPTALNASPAIAESSVAAKKSAMPAPSAKKDVSSLDSTILQSRHPQTGVGERRKIETSIIKAARKYDLPPNLIKSVIRAESNFQVKAVSHAGAQGLMQLMPATARELGVNNPFNIEENIDGGSRYLRKMLNSFGGDLKLALAAYNAGPEAVIKYGGKVPPYRETQQYVRRVLRFTKQLA
jgi:soluble lytic murein transglycosylase-like protein